MLVFSVIFVLLAIWILWDSTPDINYTPYLSNEEEMDREYMEYLKEAQEWCEENPLQCKG